MFVRLSIGFPEESSTCSAMRRYVALCRPICAGPRASNAGFNRCVRRKVEAHHASNLAPRTGVYLLLLVVRSSAEKPVTTLLHSYRLVVALLYRMQSRSAIAEGAWDAATTADLVDPALFGQTSVSRLNAVRDRAIELIKNGEHTSKEKTHAISAVHQAVHAAISVDMSDILSALTKEVVAG